MKQRLNYSNVMATIALFVALGGTSYAATKITSKDIRNNSVRGKDIKNNSLGGSDVRNGSLSSRDLKDGSIPVTRWLLLNEAGDIEEQSGGFTVVSKPNVNGQPPANPNVYIDAGETLVNKGLSATIAIQNKLNRVGDPAPDPAFQGDAAIGRCNTGAVMCVPNGTNVDNVFVVRALANNADAASQTRRVYVQLTP